MSDYKPIPHEDFEPLHNCGDEAKEQAASELPAPTGSPTWPIVLEFAKRMEAKLEKNRHKGDREGWLADDIDDLLERLREEVCELDTAICEAHVRLYEPANAEWMARKVADEAADVANFALFIADWHQARAKSGNSVLGDTSPEAKERK